MSVETYLPLYSSNIEQAVYDGDASELIVTFKSGDEYRYTGVPVEVYNGLKKARSAGEYFARQIKGLYPYEEV